MRSPSRTPSPTMPPRSPNESTMSNIMARFVYQKFNLILNIHWLPEQIDQPRAHFIVNDHNTPAGAPVVITNPNTDEHLHRATITLNLSVFHPVTLQSLARIDPRRKIFKVEVIDTAGLQFTENEARGVAADKWDKVFQTAVGRTRRKIAAEERNYGIVAERDFDIDDGDDEHFGDFEDHEAMITGNPADKDEYVMV